jgi:hypothetical protein
MATEKQILANRRNAQLSTGPRTESGKSVCRLNALRHGLTGQIDVRTPEEQQAHDEFCSGIVGSLAPDAGLERQLAQSIAEDHWRLNRARSLENNIFAITATFQDSGGETGSEDLDAALAYARTYIADPGRLNLLSLYERRIHGNMTRTLQQLRELQAERRRAEEKAGAVHARVLEEECLLVQLADAEGEPYEPPQDGSVFSITELRAAARRRARLEQARKNTGSRTTGATHPFDTGLAGAYTNLPSDR